MDQCFSRMPRWLLRQNAMPRVYLGNPLIDQFWRVWPYGSMRLWINPEKAPIGYGSGPYDPVIVNSIGQYQPFDPFWSNTNTNIIQYLSAFCQLSFCLEELFFSIYTDNACFGSWSMLKYEELSFQWTYDTYIYIFYHISTYIIYIYVNIYIHIFIIYIYINFIYICI